MGSRLEFDDFIESLDSGEKLNIAPHKDSSSFYEQPIQSNYGFDPLTNNESLTLFDQGTADVARGNNVYNQKSSLPAGSDSTVIPAAVHTSAHAHPADYAAAVGHPSHHEKPSLQSQEYGQHRSSLGMPFDSPQMWSHSNVHPESHAQHASPAMQTSHHSSSPSFADPVINVVAPEEMTSEVKQYADEAYPMYSADGVPIHGSQVPEFQQIKIKTEIDSIGGGGGAGNDYAAKLTTLASPVSPSISEGHTPYGTPQISPMMAPGSPNSAVFSGSPVSADGPHSPYEVPYYSVNDGSLSPLIDDDEPLFDTLPQPASTQGTKLGVPRSISKSRSLSDSWNPRERDAFLESLDAQTQVAREYGRHHQHHPHPHQQLQQPGDRTHALSHNGAGQQGPVQGPVGAEYLAPEAVNQISFPSYIPVHIQPHSPRVMYTSGTNGGGDSKANSSASSLSSAGTSPNSVLGPDHHHTQSGSGQNSNDGSPLLTVPLSGRSRSLSSPYEHTNDFKSAQMFSCELCGKRFTRAYNLRSHMRTHTDERPFSCQHCGKAFARQHDRKRHEALHSGEKRFVCYGLTHGFQWGCQKRFARADALGRHFRTEAGKNCLRPLIERICANGIYKDSAPEGILFGGFGVDDQPQLILNVPERDSNTSLSSEEREEHTRRTVIVTAVTEQFQELVDDPSRH